MNDPFNRLWFNYFTKTPWFDTSVISNFCKNVDNTDHNVNPCFKECCQNNLWMKHFITRQNAYSKTGYSFKGWNEKADGTGTSWSLTSAGVYESGKTKRWTYTYNITLYAVWQKNTFTCKKAYDTCSDNDNGYGGCYSYISVQYHTETHTFGSQTSTCQAYFGSNTWNCLYCPYGSLYNGVCITSTHGYDTCSSGWTKTNGACYKYDQTSCPSGSEAVTGS